MPEKGNNWTVEIFTALIWIYSSFRVLSFHCVSSEFGYAIDAVQIIVRCQTGIWQRNQEAIQKRKRRNTVAGVTGVTSFETNIQWLSILIHIHNSSFTRCLSFRCENPSETCVIQSIIRDFLTRLFWTIFELFHFLIRSICIYLPVVQLIYVCC